MHVVIRPRKRNAVLVAAVWFCIVGVAFGQQVEHGNSIVMVQADSIELPRQTTSEERLTTSTALTVEARCSPVQPGGHEVSFTWRPADRRDVRQRIDITRYRDGFETEQYETIAAMSADQARFEWTGGEPGISYLWRVVTILQDGTLAPSNVSRFDPPICPVDFQPESGDVKEPPVE